MRKLQLRSAVLRSPLAALCLLTVVGTTGAQETAWPKEVDFADGTLTLYQPQPETLSGNALTGRAAASYRASPGDEPTFGTLWFDARIDADQSGDMARVREIRVTRARWPEVTEEEERRVTESLTRTFAEVVIPVSREALAASLATAQVERRSLEGLNHEPPRILFSEELAELLQYDGAPRTLPIPDTDLAQVANAPFAVVKDGADYYLSGGKIWYGARDPMGPWSPIDAPPADVARVVPPDTSSIPAPQPPPKIVVATEPSELVVTDGPPEWRPIGVGDLLYVQNTETPIVRDVATNDVLLLLSGRWFRSASMDGPWSFVPPDELPAAFREIPPASDLAGARTSVAGTPEAEDAVLDMYLPQTAAIRRSEATLEVTYDGAPRFERISGTNIDYAVNTAAQVLRVDGRYYACDDAVWFVAEDPMGPWTLADEIPEDEFVHIPPESLAYNLTHVHVYDSTPEVVYVGYTPGYRWSYPYSGVPVYGTGWHYPPYWGPGAYYPRPPSYGLHVGYNPWTGWTFGFSWSWGFMNVGAGFGGGYGGYYRPGWGPGRGPGWGGGYYPPGGYRPPLIINTGDINIGNRVTPVPLNAARPAIAAAADRRGSLYQQGANRDRVAEPLTLDRARQVQADRKARGPNNVLADRDGNVYQRLPGGEWNSREEGTWKPTVPEARPGEIGPTVPITRPARPEARPQPMPSRPRPEARPQPLPARPQARPAPSPRPSTRPATRPVPQNVQRDYRARARSSARAMPVRGRGGARMRR
ncbi:MAG: carbohydrate-binding family V/XII [Gemmatimonadota bacterium]